MTNAELADQIERWLADDPDHMGLHSLSEAQWRGIVAALRRRDYVHFRWGPKGYEIVSASERQPSSDQVLVPREPTGSMLEAAEEIDARCRAGFLGIGASIGMVYRAMLAAAEAEGRNS